MEIKKLAIGDDVIVSNDCLDEQYRGVDGVITEAAGNKQWRVQLSTYKHPLPFGEYDLIPVEQTSSAA